jgi:hypothetical protein
MLQEGLFQKFQEDFVQIPTQKSPILCFCLNGLVKRPNAHQSATSVRTTWQYRPDSHQCREASNKSRLHPFERHGNTFGCYSEFERFLAFQCICLDDMAIPSGRQSVLKENKVFLLKHGYRKTAAIVRIMGLRHPDAILDKARRWEELQPSWRQGNTVRMPVLTMAITCSWSSTARMLGQHRPNAALFRKYFQGLWKVGCTANRPDGLSLRLDAAKRKPNKSQLRSSVAYK